MKWKLALWLPVGLWFVPAIRAVRFGKWAWDGYADTGSINAWNDWHFATSLGLAYLLSGASSILICWLLLRAQNVVRWTLWGISILCLSHLIWLAPEEPIVLFPTLSPLRFGLQFGILGTVGVASYLDGRSKTQTTS